MRNVGVIALVLLVLVGVSHPSPARARGVREQEDRHFDGHRFHHFRDDRTPFFFGLGAGALATAPFWCPPAYPDPVYAYPAVQTPLYSYYCQSPPGYYPYVPQCPGGWLTVVPPADAP